MGPGATIGQICGRGLRLLSATDFDEERAGVRAAQVEEEIWSSTALFRAGKFLWVKMQTKQLTNTS